MRVAVLMLFYLLQVIVHIQDFASFPATSYSVNISENIDTGRTLLIDLNATEEGSTGISVNYSISNIDTEGKICKSVRNRLHETFGNTNRKVLAQVNICAY